MLDGEKLSTIIEIAKFSEEEYNNDVWKKLFITNDIESLRGDEIMNEVVDKILDYNSDKAIAEQLRAEKYWRRDYNTSMDVAREEGEKSAKLETAKKLLKLGIGLYVISEATGLSIEEIEAL